MSKQTNVSCPICGALNPPEERECGACGFTLVKFAPEENLDAILEDLLDLPEMPPAGPGPTTPAKEETEADDDRSEHALDSLLAELQPSTAETTPEPEPPKKARRIVAEAPPEAVEPAEVVEPPVVEEEPVAETAPEAVPEGMPEVAAEAEPEVGPVFEPAPARMPPPEAEGPELTRISGHKIDAVVSGTVAALVAVFLFFRMDRNPFDLSKLFDLSNPIPGWLFAVIAVGGTVAAFALGHRSKSEMARGDRLMKQGLPGDAVRHYERAIRIVRRPIYAWNARGVAMKRLGRLDEALRSHENAIRLDPQDEVAWCDRGTVFLKKGELDKALECFEKAIEIRSTNAIAWNKMGIVLARMGRFDKADKCHEEATKLRPQYVAAWLNRGVVLAHMGARDEAQLCLERARSLGGKPFVAA